MLKLIETEKDKFHSECDVFGHPRYLSS